MDWTEAAKRKAATEAVKHVKDGFVVGLGSGSTAAHAIENIGDRVVREGLHVLGVPTSYQASMLAVKYGISLTTLEEHSTPDLTIDGADQIDRKMDLIKGMGGALAREKIVASSSKEFIVIADETKRVGVLGENDHPVPLEILPFALKPIMSKIVELGGSPVLREGKGKVGPVITDNGNVVVDAHFGLIRAPGELEAKLKGLAGVVETGLFVDMADIVYFGKPTDVEKIERRRSTSTHRN